jgi:hypothetical protein
MLPNGEKTQVSRERLHRHFAAAAQAKYGSGHPETSGFVPELRQKRLASGETLYVKGNWRSDDGPIALLRIDVDAHNGQRDGEALLSWATQRLGQGKVILPTASSEGGWSAWVWATVPRFVDRQTGELRPSMKLKDANKIIDDLRQSLAELAKSAGFEAKVEVQGGWLQTHCEYDKHGQPLTDKTIPDGALHGKWGAKISAKWFASIEAVERLANAKLSIESASIQSIISEAAPLRAAAKAKKLRLERQLKDILAGRLDGEIEFEGKSSKRTVRQRGNRESFYSLMRELTDLQEKHRTAWHFCNYARLTLNIITKGKLIARRGEVFELALELYAESGLGSGGRTRRREARFSGALRKLIEWFDDSKVSTGTSGVRFDIDDIIDTEGRFRGLFSNAELTASKISLRALAVVACTMRLNTHLNAAGDCPTRAIRGMLKYWRLPYDGSLVARAIALLIAKQVLKVVRVASKGVSRAYRVIKTHLFGFIGARGDEVMGDSPSAHTPPGPGAEAPPSGNPIHSSSVTYRDDGWQNDVSWEAADGPNPDAIGGISDVFAISGRKAA